MNVILGKQSILDREQKVIAYELLFRSIDKDTVVSDTKATASVVSSLLSIFDSQKILGNKKGFINIGIDMLKMDLLSILDPKSIVIEILENQEPSEEMVALIRDFKSKGYTFALDDFICTPQNIEYWAPVLEEVDIVKIDVLLNSIENIQQSLKKLRKFNVRLLAEKVEDQEMFETFFNMDFDYFQGYFFMIPEIVEGRGVPLNMQGVIDLYRLCLGDADINTIESEIKKFPDISISLLKLINSASVAPVQKITSIRQTISLLGKKTIMNWLLLTIYSQNKNRHKFTMEADPIFLAASQRAIIAELIAKKCPNPIARQHVDEAFLTGLLSMASVVLHMPIEEILDEVNVDQIIRDAILSKKGLLGDILALIEAHEKKDYKVICALCYDLKITIHDLNDFVMEAWKFSSQLTSN
ncbi:MAG: EAL and HDOD domain-containing protein [Brevinema sp.]